MVFLRSFVKDYSIIIASTVTVFVFLMDRGNDINNFLTSQNIITHSNDGIHINFFVQAFPYMLLPFALAIGGIALIIIRQFKTGDANSELALFLTWFVVLMAFLIALAKPLNWWTIAINITFIFFLVWVLVKYLLSN